MSDTEQDTAQDIDQIAVMSSVLRRAEKVIAGVRPDQREQVTPCADWTVAHLLDHMVGTLEIFAAGAVGDDYQGDLESFRVGPDPAGEFGASAAQVIDGWSTHGVDRAVKTTGGEMPGPMVLGMTVMEYLAHTWDLAVATGQEAGFSDDEVALGLGIGQQILPPDFRGPGQVFAAEVAVAEDASLMERFVGFMGRDPDWAG